MAGAVLPGFLLQTTKFGDFPKHTAYSSFEPDESESGTPEQTQMSSTTTEEDDEPDNIKKQGPRSKYFPCEAKPAKLKTPRKGRKRAIVQDHIQSECMPKLPTTVEQEYSHIRDAIKTDISDTQGTDASWYNLDKYSHRPSTWDPFTVLEPDTTDPAYIDQKKKGLDLDDEMTGDLRYDVVLKFIRKNGANGRTVPLRDMSRKHLVRESDAYDVGFFLREFGAAKCVDDAHSGYISLNPDFEWDVLDARRKHEAELTKYDAADLLLDTHMEWAQKTLESLRKEHPYSYVTKEDLSLKSNSIILAKTYGTKREVADLKLKVTNAKNVVKVEGNDLFNVRWPREAVTEIDKIKKRNAGIAIDKQNGFKVPERSSSNPRDLTEDDIAMLRNVFVQPSTRMDDGRSVAEVLLQKGVDPDFISLITQIPKEELVEPPKKKLSKEEILERKRQNQREKAKIKRDEAKKKLEAGLKNKRTEYSSPSRFVHLDIARLNADSSSSKSSSSPEYPPSLSDCNDNAILDSEDNVVPYGNAMLHYEDAMHHYRNEMFCYGDEQNFLGDETIRHEEETLHLGEDILLEEEEIHMEGEEVFMQGEEVLMVEEEVLIERDGEFHHGNETFLQGNKMLYQGDEMLCPKDELLSHGNETLSLGNKVRSAGDKTLQHKDDMHQNGEVVLRMIDASIEDKSLDYAGEWVDEQNFENVSPLASPTGVMLSPTQCHLIPDRSCLSIGAELMTNPGFQKTLQMLSPVKSPLSSNGTVVLQSDVNNDVRLVNNDKGRSEPETQTDVFKCFLPEDYQQIALGNDKFTPDEFDQYLNNVKEDQFDMNALFGSSGKTKIDDDFNRMEENDNIFNQKTGIDFSSVVKILKS